MTLILVYVGQDGVTGLPSSFAALAAGPVTVPPGAAVQQPTALLWDLAAPGSAAVRAALAAEAAAGFDWDVRLLEGAPGLEQLLVDDPFVGSEAGTLVAFGASRARDAHRAVRSAAEKGISVRLVPEGLDLHREAVVFELWRLYELTGRLRRECPWDRKQTQEDIVAYTLEETYELVDSIRDRSSRGDAAVRGELGDLLFQVYFLACVAEENGLYDLGDVAAGIHSKLVRRHPHIFADASADTPEDVRRTWDAIKRDSEGREGIFHDIPEAFPGLLLAQKLQQRAAAVGFDWGRPREVMAKLKEEIGEIEAELALQDAAGGAPGRAAPAGAAEAGVAREVGDLLFSVVNLARKLGVDPELALRGSALRFRERVEEAALTAGGEGYEFEHLDLEGQETYYQRAKHRLAASETETKATEEREP